MYTDCIEQLRGTAGARQVRVRAETALGALPPRQAVGDGSCLGSSRTEGLSRGKLPVRECLRLIFGCRWNADGPFRGETGWARDMRLTAGRERGGGIWAFDIGR